ncbi:hypothetical protein NEFER03_1571 [Nematocida sp. LUAm3]|nr:hypothetical protein NEFER03_1571 [Nematocida sp. LUAm3]KAI5176103.1 hypothetical protein NEFER02_1924 [Nematocida sp. LUAm2]KAI5178991.1 hypothetical protein NEFER01_1867 [Nematocida sp. LUAm1]
MFRSKVIQSVLLPATIDKILAINMFFFIWIVIGYIRRWSYFWISDKDIASWDE